MAPDCGHPLCELIGGACSIATGRSRGCTPSITSKEVDPALFDEIRELLAVIAPGERDERTRTAAIRLAEIVRREAREDRFIVGLARVEEPELAPALEQLCLRRR